MAGCPQINLPYPMIRINDSLWVDAREVTIITDLHFRISGSDTNYSHGSYRSHDFSKKVNEIKLAYAKHGRMYGN